MTNHNQPTTKYVEVHFKDYGVQGEYGFFGKTVLISDVRNMTATEVMTEIEKVREVFGTYLIAVPVEEV